MTKSSSKRKPRRNDAVVDGVVTSTRGRGLRGIEVFVVDAGETVVAAAVTDAGGAFVVSSLPDGSYRLHAVDPDGDFAPGWVGGTSFGEASKIKLNDKHRRRTAELQLTSAADIEVTSSDHDGATELHVSVTERGTGVAASGRVRVVNKLIGVELPLAEGSARITLHAPGGSAKLPKKVSVDYRGDEHTAPASQPTRLR